MQSSSVLSSGRNTLPPVASAPSSSASSHDMRTGAIEPDADLSAASRLRALSNSTLRGSALDAVPTSMFPMGTSNWGADAHFLIIDKDLGPTTVHRSNTQISVKNPLATATIQLDGQNPSLVDVALHLGGSALQDQTYKGTLKAIPGGFTATTTDGNSLSFEPNGAKVSVTGTGWPHLPGGAKLVLTPH